MINEYYLSNGLEKVVFEEVLGQIHLDFPGVEVQVEDRLRFYEYHFENLEKGLKTCTIRFKKDAIRVPCGKEDQDILPCFATKPDDPNYLEEKGVAWIPHITVAHVKDFPLWLAEEDGFASLAEMKKGIGNIYGVTLQPEDILSYYKILEYADKDWL
jgi:hypothetical protein